MADIRVTLTGTREFKVVVGEGQTNYRVTVPEGLIEELQLPEDDLDNARVLAGCDPQLLPRV
jgi:hypothetical protein